ncbi:MAG: 16S rRNA (guanine(527)-N(7))-methyltransferase RsmG [Bacteroidales bacterium]|nr:16S rRNA (guanine(527)-N(7))-methyltransferase RsmG [Bacteroidales bacterium]
MDSGIIAKYFPNLSDKQQSQFAALGSLYPEWNEKINVISRNDIDELFTRHILHSLAIAKFSLLDNSKNIIDVGTGGGFPGIPLAIMYPEKQFTLIDSIGKKISVVQDVIEKIGLTNATAQKINSNDLHQKFDTIVSRAVTAFPNFVKQTHKLLEKSPTSSIVYLKGGDFEEEIAPFRKHITLYNISDVFEEEFFETKKVIKYMVGKFALKNKP